MSLLVADQRCLDHDHHWSDEDLYFEGDAGYEARPDQMDAKCIRCGVTMRESLGRLIDELKQMMRPN